jgi:rare lipoprotein A
MNFKVLNSNSINMHLLVLTMIALLSACGGNPSLKSTSKAPDAAKQEPTSTSNNNSATKSEPKPGSGGYYLDDGPGDNPPDNIDSIPGAS